MRNPFHSSKKSHGENADTSAFGADRSLSITAMMFFRVRDGIDVENMLLDPTLKDSPKVRAFTKMNEIFSGERSIITHYWGLDVEDRSICIFALDWTSFEALQAFRASEPHQGMSSCIQEMFDVDNFPTFVLHSRFRQDPTSAFAAPVTGISFFTFPVHHGEPGKIAVEDSLAPLLSGATTVGKSTGGALGWVTWMKGVPPGTPPPESILQMVFGYASLEDRQSWTQSESYKHGGSILNRLGNDGLASRAIYGKSFFQIRFYQGL